jgi:aminoglycoside phosphotransferase (APT) family kinase protein
MLLAGRVDPRHITRFAQILADIHRKAWQRRSDLANEFADRASFESLRLEPYYAYTASKIPEAAKFLDDLIEFTRSRRITLVHGDYSPKNILVHGKFADQLVLLDHEVIHWGDPAFDVGFALAHLFSKARHVIHQRVAFLEVADWFVQTYTNRIAGTDWTADLDRAIVSHTLGCMLARVAGRSTLEYLSEEERRQQQSAVVELMRSPPPNVAELKRILQEQMACAPH